MTIETKIICDYCQKEIKSIQDIAFTVTSMICGLKFEMHFCNFKCLKVCFDERFKA